MFVKQTGESAPDDVADYDPSAFYTADAGGEVVRARVSSDLMRSVLSLVLDPDFPDYHTQADVFRDALVHLIYRRAHQSKDPVVLERLAWHLRCQRVMEIEAQCQKDEDTARAIISRWPKAIITVKQELFPVARALLDRPIDDNLKDQLRGFVRGWVAGEHARAGMDEHIDDMI